MQLTSGMRLRSQVCPTEAIVVRPAPVELTCGGHPMIALDASPGEGLSVEPGLSDGNQMGKRYTDAEGQLEVLVTKAGEGTLAAGSTPLTLKSAKPLPSSD